MTSVIVIRAVFITKTIQENRVGHDSLWSRAGRRLLSTLRAPGSSTSSNPSSPRASGEKQEVDSNTPRINTLGGVDSLITGGNERHESLGDPDGDVGCTLHDVERPVMSMDIGGRTA